MELRLADLTPEPLFEIRGKVSLEIGRNSATNKTRFLLAASGTIKVFKLGNLASAAAKFVLEVGDDFADIEFWGVAAFQTNFEFLEQYGIYLPARCCCRSTRPSARSPRRSRSRASRAAACSCVDAATRAGAADRHVRAVAARPGLDRPAQDDADRPQPRRHGRQRPAA